jgi:hypothetical protein
LSESGLNFEKAFESGRTEAEMEGADVTHFVLYKNGKIHDI